MGVVAFVMLGGYAPFYANTQKGLFDVIMAGKYEFNARYWSNVSGKAKDLIKRLLTVNHEKRFTVDQALAHPWVSH